MNDTIPTTGDTMKRRSFLLGATALLASPMLMASTSLPPGTIKITVGWAPGGGTDVFARIVGNKLSELWGRPVVVENKPGATGMLAAEQFSKGRHSKDLNLLMAPVNTHAIAPHTLKTVKIGREPLR